MVSWYILGWVRYSKVSCVSLNKTGKENKGKVEFGNLLRSNCKKWVSLQIVLGRRRHLTWVFLLYFLHLRWKENQLVVSICSVICFFFLNYARLKDCISMVVLTKCELNSCIDPWSHGGDHSSEGRRKTKKLKIHSSSIKLGKYWRKIRTRINNHIVFLEPNKASFVWFKENTKQNTENDR